MDVVQYRNRAAPFEAIPNYLFANSEQGALFIPKPRVRGQQALFQDAAGTTPVTSDGDPVGRMLDLSGNDNHATQEVSGSRPTYRTDGNKHWLEFDLVDDFFLLPFTLPSGVLWSLRFSTTPRYADKGFAFLTKLNANNPWLFAAFEGSSSTSLAAVGVHPQLWRFDGEDVEIATRDDAWNLTQTSNVYGVDFTSNTWENVIIGEYNTNESSFVPYMHGMILRETYFSEQENSLVDAYLANLAGVSLND